MDHETILRFIGYAIQFAQAMAPAAILGALTWRVTR